MPDDDPKPETDTEPEPKRRYRDRQRFLAALAAGMHVGAAARTIGITRQCAYQWRDSDPSFALAWVEALEHRTDQIRSVEFKLAMEGYWPAVAHYLRHNHPSYAPKLKLAHGGDPDSGPIRTESTAWIYPKAHRPEPEEGT